MPRSALKIPTVAGPVSWSRATGPRRTQSSEHQRIPPRCPSPFGWKLWIVAGLILQVAAAVIALVPEKWKFESEQGTVTRMEGRWSWEEWATLGLANSGICLSNHRPLAQSLMVLELGGQCSQTDCRAGEEAMMGNRYVIWTAVWEHFQTMNVREVVPREKWDELYELLDRLWQDERKGASPEALKAYAAAHRLKH
jgi:hypothetical protein